MTTSPFATFRQPCHIYKPFTSQHNSTRLLKIGPRDEFQTISGTLHEFPLLWRICPNFSALSCEWRALDASHEIEVDGKRFVVRTNLFEALRSITEIIRQEDKVSELFGKEDDFQPLEKEVNSQRYFL